jgi:hypothetical protein
MINLLILLLLTTGIIVGMPVKTAYYGVMQHFDSSDCSSNSTETSSKFITYSPKWQLLNQCKLSSVIHGFYETEQEADQAINYIYQNASRIISVNYGNSVQINLPTDICFIYSLEPPVSYDFFIPNDDLLSLSYYKGLDCRRLPFAFKEKRLVKEDNGCQWSGGDVGIQISFECLAEEFQPVFAPILDGLRSLLEEFGLQ